MVFLVCKSSGLHLYTCYKNGEILLHKQRMYVGLGLTLGECGGGDKIDHVY